MKRSLTAFAAAIGIAACSTTAPDSPSGDAPPKNYRAAVIENVKTTFLDPYSIRDASISQPIYARSIFDGITPFPRKGWIVCVRANAKNRMGGYTGQRFTAMLFKGGVIDFTLAGDLEGQAAHHCRSAVLEPFPEIEAVR